MFSIVGAIKSLADRFAEPSNDGNPTSPQHHSAAINLLEEDGDLSDNEQVQAIQLFSHHTPIADSYFAIKKKATHTHYIQLELFEC